MGEIPKDLVPKYYEMDPLTEDLFFYGDRLMNGMVVLEASASAKTELKPPGRWFGSRKLSAPEKLNARIANRWCKVSELRVEGMYVEFIGIYADGTKHVRRMATTHPWLVRLDSLEDLTS